MGFLMGSNIFHGFGFGTAKSIRCHPYSQKGCSAQALVVVDEKTNTKIGGLFLQMG